MCEKESSKPQLRSSLVSARSGERLVSALCSRWQQGLPREPKLTEAQQDEARRRRAEGATLAELARSYHVGKSTISRLTTRRFCRSEQSRVSHFYERKRQIW
jgi:hypothetical protein